MVRAERSMDTRGLARRIARRAARVGLEVDDSLAGSLAAYVGLLERWNRRMNLTALAADDAGLDRVVVEPLVAARHLPVGSQRVIDIGSGGGSPAVPMKLAVPGVHVRMVESKTRKAVFLREVARRLKLEGVAVETSRYEELLTRPELHEAADVVTVRAVRVEGRVLHGLQALVRVGGAVFLFRGTGESDLLDEVRAPLRWRATYPLVESLRSRLVVLEKELVGKEKTNNKE